jgi:hypothetical protein
MMEKGEGVITMGWMLRGGDGSERVAISKRALILSSRRLRLGFLKALQKRIISEELAKNLNTS